MIDERVIHVKWYLVTDTAGTFLGRKYLSAKQVEQMRSWGWTVELDENQ